MILKKHPAQQRTSIYAIGWVSLFMAPYPTTFFVLLFVFIAASFAYSERWEGQRGMLKIWAGKPLVLWFLTKVVRADLLLMGSQFVPHNGPLIIITNHLSWFDPIAIQFSCNRWVRPMARRELFDIPDQEARQGFKGWKKRQLVRLGGLMMKIYGGAFPIHRHSPQCVVGLRKGRSLLGTRHAVLIFVEGKVNRSGGDSDLRDARKLVLRYRHRDKRTEGGVRKGAAHLARLTGAPTICVALDGFQIVWPSTKELRKKIWPSNFGVRLKIVWDTKLVSYDCSQTSEDVAQDMADRLERLVTFTRNL